MLDGVKVLYRRVKKYEKRICIKSKGGSTLFEHLFQLPPPPLVVVQELKPLEIFAYLTSLELSEMLH